MARGHQDLPKGDRPHTELRWIVERKAEMVTSTNMFLLPPGLLHSPGGGLKRHEDTGAPQQLVVPSGVTMVVAWDPPRPPPPAAAPTGKKASKAAASAAVDLPKPQKRCAPPPTRALWCALLWASRL